MTWLLVRLRWRLFVNHLTAVGGLDTLERVSRAGALAGPALLILILGAAATIAGATGLAVGWGIGTGPRSPATSLLVVRAVLAAGCLATIVTWLMSTAESLTLHPRVLLLPIRPTLRHRIDVAAGALADPMLLVIGSGLVLAAVGVTLAGRIAAAAVAAAAALALLAVLASLRSVVALSIGRLVRRRRAAELFTLACVLVLSLGAALPLLVTDAVRHRSMAAIAAGLPWWTVWVPTELYATAIARSVARDFAGGAVAVLALTVEALILFMLSSRLCGWLLESSGAAASARTGTGRIRELPRVYPFPATTSAVAIVQVRTALRSVRGRLIVLLPGVAMGVLYAVARSVPDELPAGGLLASTPDAALAFGLAFSLYGLLAFTMNQLAADRDGLARQFLSPISDTDLILGKALGCGLVFVVQAGMCLLCVSLVLLELPQPSSLAIVFAFLTAYLVMAPAAAVVSALLPVRADLSKTGPSGNPHGLAMLGGTVAIGVLTVIGWHLAGSGSGGWSTLVTSGVTALAALALSRGLLPMAAPLVSRRRENLVLVAEGR